MNKLFIIVILVIVFIFLNILYTDYFNNIEKLENSRKSYAVCIWGELRGVKSTIGSFYEHLVKPLNSDIFIVCQKSDINEIDNNIDLFNDNVVTKTLYTKPKTSDYFTDIDKLKHLDKNMLYEGGLQVFLNFKKIADEYGDILERDYEYIILTRSDFKYLFDMPDVFNISKSNDIFWSYEDDNHGGINNNLSIIPSKYIKNYLYAAYNYLTKPELINKILKNNEEFNCEKLMKFIFLNEKWSIGLIKSNSYITADSSNEKTTWGTFKYCDKRKVFYKYEVQFKNSYNNLETFNKGDKWEYFDLSIYNYRIITFL